MADDWDDVIETPKPTIKKPSNDDDWGDDPTPAKPANNQNFAAKKNNDDDWNDDPMPANNRTNGNSTNKKNNDNGWDDEPTSSTKSNGKRTSDWDDGDDWGTGNAKCSRSNDWNGEPKNNDNSWNDSGSSSKNSFTNRNNSDRPRRPDWICDACGAKVFASKRNCFKCQADKGNSKDAPPDSGSSRGGRANDWICDACSARVFGSKTSCFKCQADKGNSKDAPPDSGASRGGRASDWICDACSARVFGSKTSCFKCQADKGNSKDAPPDSGSSRGGRANDWICDECGAKVFGSKTSCFKCQADKGNSKDAPADAASSSSWGEKSSSSWGDKKEENGTSNGNRAGSKPDDWTCVCGVSNFATREECFKCKEPRPEGVGAPKKEIYNPIDVTVDELYGAGISTGINFSKFNDIPVKVTDTVRNQEVIPCRSFKEAGLGDYLLQNIEKSKYKNPTPIQQYAIPIISMKRDLMACAQTGSGKTAAFLLPIIQNLLADNAPKQIARPYAVILTPTRELCTQIYNEARKFSQGSFIKCCQIYGGTGVRNQNAVLNEGCHILVATPGRFIGFCDKAYVTFENLRYFVLDEADRMLDMGFIPEVDKIMGMPTMKKTGDRQTLMFSATFPNQIQRLAGKYLHEYIFLTVGIVGGASSDVTQTVFEVQKTRKRDKLFEILKEEDPRGTIVFVETKRTADFLAIFLSESDQSSTSIHGDRFQNQREQALNDFKSGNKKVLIATSVAARGLDIPGVRHVINYDIPKSIDEYVHRIGRTGRVGNVGKATSFFDSDQNAEIAPDLLRILKESKQTVPDFLSTFSGGGDGSSGSNPFGGTDYRNKSAPPPAHGGGGDDEEW